MAIQPYRLFQNYALGVADCYTQDAKYRHVHHLCGIFDAVKNEKSA